MGDINVDLRRVGGDRAEDIALTMNLLGLQNLDDFFHCSRGRWTYSQLREGRYVRSVTDCILTKNPERFVRWAVKIPRYNSDHRALIAEIPVDWRQHFWYRWSRSTFPITLAHPLTKIDQMYENLRMFKHHPPQTVEDQRTRSWIAFDTWSLIDQRAALRRLVTFSCNPPKRLRTAWMQDVDIANIDIQF